ncbi:MAG: ATP-dependent Clp protease proteolytic subunit [Bacteroidales bacterium]
MAFFKIYSDIANENEAVGFFGDKMDVLSAVRVSEFINSLTADDAEIDGRIHCRGGDVIEGYAIHDLIQNSGKVIRMTVEGQCASIATVLLLAAKPENRSIYKNATVFIHNPFIPEYTLADAYEAKDLEAIASELRAHEDKLLNFYVEKTGADKEVLRAKMTAETSLTAEEAKELGFVSKIIEPVLAYKSNKSFNQIVNKMNKEQFDKLDNELKAKSSLLDKVLAKLGLKSVKDSILAMDMTAADGTVVTIETDGGDPAVGQTASPNGTFVMTDGQTITIADGKVSEITEATPAEDTMTAEQIAAMKSENETLKAQNAELAIASVSAKAATDEAVALVKELQAIKSTYTPAARQQPSNEPKLTKAQEKLAKYKELQAKK